MRLDKMVADCAAVTRSEARKFIKNGQVCLNGAPKTDIAVHVSENDALTINGATYAYKKFIYLMLNKPQGCISATSDGKQKTVMDLIEPSYRRYKLFPAGRLDIDTTGFLLITNDGELAHRLLSPNKKTGKTYVVTSRLPVTEKMLALLERGVDIGECVTSPARAERMSACETRLTIYEGKFHQIKRMFAAVGNEVTALRRIAYGDLYIDESLKEGQYRSLTDEEISLLRQIG